MDPENVQCSMGCKSKKVAHGFLKILLSNCVFSSSSAATRLLSIARVCILESAEAWDSVVGVRLDMLPCAGEEEECVDDIGHAVLCLLAENINMLCSDSPGSYASIS